VYFPESDFSLTTRKKGYITLGKQKAREEHLFVGTDLRRYTE